VIGQAPFVLATPLITRLFPAPELGLYGVALAFVGMIGPVAGLRLELAAISARSQDDARALSLLSVLAILPVTVASTVLLCALKVLGI
jgi:O-antigen/teichoic acid export membrane protein